MNEMKDFIEQYSKLLPLAKSISYVEAERRASEFLTVMATITNWRHMFSEEKIKLTSVQSAVYAVEIGKGTDKTVTINKLNAEASKEYTDAREALERVENDLSYLKTYYEIFLNGHLFYRSICREARE